MNVQTIQIKLQQRVNKLSSKDFDNIQPWMVVEVYNKSQVEWCRRQLIGNNPSKTGGESTVRRIDDLNVLLTTLPLTLTHFTNYDQSTQVPKYPSGNAYLEYNHIEMMATKECCDEPRKISVYQGEEANVPWYLDDDDKKPSFEWGETFMTFYNNRARIYHAGEFVIKSANLIYYRQPKGIQIAGVSDPYSGLLAPTDVIPEFKDDIVELVIDDAAAIILGDIENWPNQQREMTTAERNN